MNFHDIVTRRGGEPSAVMLRAYDTANRRLAAEIGHDRAFAAAAGVRTRSQLRDHLREIGLSRAQAERAAAAAWRALSSETAEATDAIAKIRAATTRLRQ